MRRVDIKPGEYAVNAHRYSGQPRHGRVVVRGIVKEAPGDKTRGVWVEIPEQTYLSGSAPRRVTATREKSVDAMRLADIIMPWDEYLAKKEEERKRAAREAQEREAEYQTRKELHTAWVEQEVEALRGINVNLSDVGHRANVELGDVDLFDHLVATFDSPYGGGTVTASLDLFRVVAAALAAERDIAREALKDAEALQSAHDRAVENLAILTEENRELQQRLLDAAPDSGEWASDPSAPSDTGIPTVEQLPPHTDLDSILDRLSKLEQEREKAS